MTTATVISKKDLINSPVTLPTGQTSGSFKMSIPFPADYIMVLNDTIATIAASIGEVSSQTADAQIWTPGKYISLPLIQQTQKITVFWTSPQPIPADNNIVQFYFSNVTIPLQGGNISGNMPSSVSIDSFNQSLPSGVNNIGKVDVNSLPAFPALSAGTNNIGKVDVNNLPGITSGPTSSSQIQVTTAVTALVNGVTNGQKIKIRNGDTTNSIFLGTNAVAATTGYELGPKEFIDLDIVSGSNLAIYGIAAAGTPTASVLVLN